MVHRLVQYGVVAASLCLLAVSGCSKTESDGGAQSEAKAQEQASGWTPEMKEQFKSAKSDPINQR